MKYAAEHPSVCYHQFPILHFLIHLLYVNPLHIAFKGMEGLLTQGLRFGAVIEVFFTVEKGEEEPQKLWWPASVEKVSLIQDHRGTTLSANIKFHAMHGFRSSSQTMTFQEDQQVRDRGGVVYSWRFVPEASVSDGMQPVSDKVGTDGCDEEYNPTEERSVLRKRASPPAQEEEGPTQDQLFHLKNKRILLGVEHTLSRLQQQVKGQAVVISRLDGEFRTANPYAFAEHLQPLEFLRTRIQPILEKAPTVPTRTTAHDLRHGFSFYSAECIRRGSDCTLLQLDSIVDHIRQTVGTQATFEPDYDTIKSSAPSQVRITFETFLNLSQVFAPNPRGVVKDAIIKKKFERGSATVIALRMLGAVVQSSQDDSLPMYVTVGESIPSSGSEGIQKQVVMRQNTVWNNVEGMFVAPLQLKTISSTELQVKAREALGQEAFVKNKDRYEFSITWRSESHSELQSIFAKSPEPKDVLGVLEVCIPYVLVKGMEHCEDFSTIASQHQFLM